MVRSNKLFNISIPLLVLGLIGCGSTDFGGATSTKKKKPPPQSEDIVVQEPEVEDDPQDLGLITDSFAVDGENLSSPVDIIFLVDTSGSMGDEKARLEQNMELFLNDFFANNASLDYQLFLVGENFQFPAGVASNPQVNIVNERIGSHDALDVAVRMLTQGLPNQTLTLRPDANTELIVVSDDDARGAGISSLEAMIIDNTTPLLRLHGLVGLQNGFNSITCNIPNVGSAYMDLALKSQPAGLIQDLCLNDWTILLAELGKNILDAVPLEYVLSDSPDLDREFLVLADGVQLDSAAYTFDEASNTISVDRASVSDSTAAIDVKYYPLTP